MDARQEWEDAYPRKVSEGLDQLQGLVQWDDTVDDHHFADAQDHRVLQFFFDYGDAAVLADAG